MSYGRRLRGRVVVLTTVLVVLIFGWPTAPLATASAANVSVSIGSATIVANANAQVTMFFPVTLSQPSTTAVSVSYATQAGTAPSTWYRAASGTLTFPVNPLTGTTSVEKLAAIVVSPFSLPCITRAFSVHLSAPVGATLANQVGTGTIMSCATAGATRVNAGDMRLYGGAGGTNRAAYIPVTLSSAAPGPVVVHYVIAGVTAARPANFRAPILGTMTIAAGSVQTWAGITVVSGSVQNPPKSFVVKLTSATGAALGRSTGTVTIIPEPQALLFDDEFNGKALDLSKWQPNWLGATNATITKPVNSEELSCYDPHQVTEPGDGRLHLNAVRRSCHAANGVTYSMASGLVETRKHFTFTYGYLEARIWLPTGTSQTMNWPAFWAAGTGVWKGSRAAIASTSTR